MQIAKVLIFALQAAAGAYGSWTIPKDQPDGTYIVSIDEAGNSVHEKVDTPAIRDVALDRRVNSAKFSPRADIFARGEIYSIHCVGYYLDHASADAAVTGLKNQCGSDGVVKSGLSFYTKSGTAVAYFCNYASGSNTCYSWEVTDALVTKGPAICGNYAGVWVYFNVKQGEYGQLVDTASFC